MTPERFQRVREVFEEAFERPPAERAEHVRRACAGDDELRGHVERLLAHAGRDSAPLDTRPLADPMDAAWRDHLGKGRPPDRIGGFRLLGLVGRGGMGEVYEAEQDHPRRRVAIKLLRADLLTPEARRRFEFEAQVLGALQHPGIACVHAAGVLERADGPRPYFVMEFIRGRALDAYARAADLPVRARLELFARVCEALDHAHRAGVVHRDLKPSNIMVDEHGGPKILDFGVARLARGEGEESVRSMHTAAGELVGTVAYMSPEQVSGGAHRADARTDVYALGVVLFELLTGRLPFDLRGRSLPEVARIIRDDEPTSLGALDNRLQGDLDTIVAKAMEKDPARRYPAAGELAADLRRYLRDEPIVARPATATYQIRKFARRHRELVAGVAAAFLALAVGLVAVTRLAVREAHQRRVAEASAAEARRAGYRNCIAAADQSLRLSDAAHALGLLDSAPAGDRGWEWRYLRALADQSRLSIQASDAPVRSALLAGGAVWTAGDDGRIARWDPADGRAISSVPAHAQPVTVLTLSPDGRTCVSGTAGGELAAWDAADGSLRWRFQGGGEVHDQLFFPDGRSLAVPMQQRIAFVDARTGAQTGSLSLPVAGASRAAVSADGTLLTCLVGQVLACYSLEDGRERWRRNGRCRFDHTGERVWNFSGAARGVLLLDAPTGRILAEFPDAAGLERGSTGPFLPALLEGATIALLEPGSPTPAHRLRGHRATVLSAWLGPDQTSLVSAGADGVVNLWDLRACGDSFVLPPSNDAVLAAAVAPDGRRAVTVGWGGVKCWDLVSGAELWTSFPVNRELHAAAFSPDGERLAAAGYDQLVVVLAAADGRTLSQTVPIGAAITRLAWPAGGSVFAGMADGARLEVDAADGTVLRRSEPAASPITALAVSPDRRLVAVGSETTGVRLGTADHLESLPGSGLTHITGLAFDPTGALLAIGRADGSVCLIGAGDRRVRWTSTPVSAGCARELAFSPDQSRLAAGFSGGSVHLLDAATGVTLLELRPTPSEVCALGFAADGSALASVSSGVPGGITVFEAVPSPAPADRAAQARARAIVDRLRRERNFADDIAAGAAALADEPDEVRQAAVRLARARGDHPNYLNGDAWSVVRFPNRTPAEYALALAKAENACRLRPDNHAYLNTLGVAQLRAGRLDEAVSTLTRCTQLAGPGEAHAMDLLPLAIARARQGRLEEARVLIERARADRPRGQQPTEPEYDWFMAEAEGALGEPDPAAKR